MPVNKRILIACIFMAMILCAAQIVGSTMLILPCLALFMALMAWGCVTDFTLPLLLFFLPWSPILKISPGSFSFFTLAIVMICFISVIKKKLKLKRYNIVTGFALVTITLLAKFIDSSGISFSYLAFMMLIVLFPVVKEEWKAQRYDFYTLVLYFSLGIIIAALCAQRFAGYGNIARYIQVFAYHSVRRLCGFYNDPNFYSAQITAAMGGALLLILRERGKARTMLLGALLIFLVYCGMLSGSKSFVVVMAVLLVLWVIEFMRLRGRTGLKTFLIIFTSVAVIYIASSAIFGGLIDILKVRFSFSSNLSDITTGRTELWANYLHELYSDPKLLFLGMGFTNVKLDGRASHNIFIQMVFQFGVIGSVFLMAWCLCFFKGVLRNTLFSSKRCIAALIIMAGAFMPWLAIDPLYFDEFFLMQWYVFVGLVYIINENKTASQTPGGNAAGPGGKKRHRMRVVWE